ncbi:unnamed protein product [Paramecium sonneborni]|uniref:Uncharacterized protein n=1 Tax=Paramecium sonneborni TaxID=65129 RepID=A0A8S1RRU9_9CILI|nr:unnamed protein product [Paramecium sonneborni]
MTNFQIIQFYQYCHKTLFCNQIRNLHFILLNHFCPLLIKFPIIKEDPQCFFLAAFCSIIELSKNDQKIYIQRTIKRRAAKINQIRERRSINFQSQKLFYKINNQFFENYLIFSLKNSQNNISALKMKIWIYEFYNRFYNKNGRIVNNIILEKYWYILNTKF